MNYRRLIHRTTQCLSLYAVLGLTALELRADIVVNYALTGAATQSSTGFGGLPERAIDGNTDGNFNSASSSNTGYPPGTDEWWEVDLGEPKPIGRIELWLRTDCCSEHRENLQVVIYDRADPAGRNIIQTRQLITPSPDLAVFEFSPAVTGQVVRVEHFGGVELPVTLAEVRVFNQPLPELRNFAREGLASASSEGWGTTAASAIDGNWSGNFSTAGMFVSSTRTDPSPFWQVDLLETKAIGHVEVWLRTDYCLPCSQGLRVTVLDEAHQILFRGVPEGPLLRNFGFSFGPSLPARYVQIDLQPDFPSPVPPYQVLQIAEVEVLGIYPPEPLITFTAPPESQTISAGEQATFGPVAALVDGAVLPGHVGLQWLRNGVEIPLANATTYTTPFQSVGNHQDLYSVRVQVPGYSLTSGEVELRVVPESTPPLLTNLTFAAARHLNLWLHFNEPVAPETVIRLDNYTFADNVSILNASPGADGHSVVLGLADLLPYSGYSLRVGGITDLSGNALLATNLSGTVGFYEVNLALEGQATQSSVYYAGFPWHAIDGVTDGAFNSGSVTHNQPPETGGWWEVDLGSEQAIGRLVFWWRTDDCCLDRQDNFTLRLLDASRATVRDLTYPGRPPSPYYALNLPTPMTAQFVRFEAPVPPVDSGAFSLAEVQVVASYQHPIELVVTTNLPPQRLVQENRSATFQLGVTAVGAPQDRITYQWQTNGVDVPGALESSYTTPVLSLADEGLVVQCRLSLPGLTTNTVATTISVFADHEPPRLLAVNYAQGETPDRVQLLLSFDEPIALSTVEDPFNYLINDNFCLLVEVEPDLQSVTLTIPALDEQFGIYRLAIDDLTDLVGNPIAPVRWEGIFPFTAENLALAGTATQSSTGYEGVPERAIDGNTDGNFWNGSVSHTGPNPQTNEWWEVDLGAPERIGRIVARLRTDCCQQHREDLRLVVYDQADPENRLVLWMQEFGHPQPDVLQFEFSPALLGQVVRVEHFGELHLPVALAEVEVFRATPPLLLEAARDGDQVSLSWPTVVEGLVLESRSALEAGSWTVVEEAIELLEGRNTVIVTATPTLRFFRLRTSGSSR